MSVILRYVIEEYDYQSGNWIPIECNNDSALTYERLQWHLDNNHEANHRIVLIKEIPAKPWS